MHLHTEHQVTLLSDLPLMTLVIPCLKTTEKLCYIWLKNKKTSNKKKMVYVDTCKELIQRDGINQSVNLTDQIVSSCTLYNVY